MTSLYRNNISLAYFLFCLFISSASAHSFIRQFTDDSNTNLQLEDVAAREPNKEEAHYLYKDQEISSRDYEGSVSTTMTGMRDLPPSSYNMKMESFDILLTSITQRYQSRPFTVGGYNWTLVVYPNGNKADGGSGYLSLYVTIDNSTFAEAHKDVYADLRFYIFNNNERKYFTIQDTNLWRFNVFKTMWGFSKVLPVDTFKDSKNGYLYDGDNHHCEFGVDVSIPTLYKTSELFTVTKKFDNPRYTWTLPRFSTLHEDVYISDVFPIGIRLWKLQVYPRGRATGKGKALSMYLVLVENEELRPYEKIYVRAKLRIIDQIQLNNMERPLDKWYGAPGYGRRGWGSNEFISLVDLKDSSRGFLVNDALIVQVEMEAMSLTKYLPS